MEEKPNSTRLRLLSLVLLSIGLIGSIGLMFYTGRRNDSVVLMALFLGWVSIPYLVLFGANLKARRWPSSTRRALYILMIAIPIVSLIVYSGILSPTGTKPAAVFLIMPLASLILSLVVIKVSLVRSRKSGGS